MTIVLPIFFAACGFGLFVRRMTPAHWTVMCFIIAAVIAYNFVKPPKPLVPIPGGQGVIQPSAQSGG